MPNLLSLADVALILGCSQRHVRQLAQDEKIAFIRIGKTKRRIHPQAVEDFLKQNETPVFVQPPKKKPLTALDIKLGKV